MLLTLMISVSGLDSSKYNYNYHNLNMNYQLSMLFKLTLYIRKTVIGSRAAIAELTKAKHFLEMHMLVFRPKDSIIPA